MTDYAFVKSVHVACALLSVSGFAVRAYWMLYAPERLRRTFVRVVPHVVDTLLLASALWLAWQIGAAGIRDWVPAKVIGLVVYVLLGTLALKRGRTRTTRAVAAVAALATFGYIVSVARSKSALGPLLWL